MTLGSGRNVLYVQTLSTFQSLYFLTFTLVSAGAQVLLLSPKSFISTSICTSAWVKNVCTLASSARKMVNIFIQVLHDQRKQRKRPVQFPSAHSEQPECTAIAAKTMHCNMFHDTFLLINNNPTISDYTPCLLQQPMAQADTLQWCKAAWQSAKFHFD